MVELLRGTGEEMQDFHIAALLCGGLSEKYDTFVKA